ncbi:UNVERIFIED_CONTAM: hypothetical protein Sindi_1697400 [Sesamum indicum]
MCKKLCEVIRCDRTSIWVDWLISGRLRDSSIWTIPDHKGPWGWRKLLRLRTWIRSIVEYRIDRFPQGPSRLGLHENAILNSVIHENQWQWPLITDMECLEITHTLPRISGGSDRIIWRFMNGSPTTQELYRLMIPPGPKVDWTSLLSGPLKIPRHMFILWLAILEKLATTDKPWLSHLGHLVLCNNDMVESHDHLFFHCRFSRRCISTVRRMVRFQWPNWGWTQDIVWGARKWRGKHIINIAYRALLGSCVYHIWKERNTRRFEQVVNHPSVTMADPLACRGRHLTRGIVNSTKLDPNVGLDPRIWVTWDDNVVDVHILELGNEFVHRRVSNRADSESLTITVVYGASEMIDRRSLWNTLETLSREQRDDPWLVGGDFNAVREMNEVCGVSGDIRTTMEEFNAAIQEAGLIPLPMQGEWYTWHNCSTSSWSLWKRLDRILINDRWLARFPSSCYHSLLPRTSDHSPLVIHGDMQHHQQTGGGMFRFDNYLTHSPEFIPSVQNIWQHSITGVPMFAVIRKLKALKPVFREQRRKKGDLTLNVQLAKGFLDEAQQLVSNDRQNEALLQLEHCCRLVYAKAVKLEQIMLQQRAKIQWMKEGDQCTRIFFRKIAQRRVARRILQINDDYGTSHTEPGEIINEFVHYYQNLLGGNRRQILIDIGFLRPWARHILSNEEASHLISIFTPDDVKQAVFDIAEDKAPGPDGYSSGFFKAAWPVVGQEVTKAVLDFFSTGKLLQASQLHNFGSNPKGTHVVLDKIISPCQGAFIPGRSIGDNILLAQELFTGYNQMRLPPRCALKVDIRKAYDTVEWDFLLAVLQLFGFPQTFTKWIEECVTTASFSIGLNGNPHGFFAGARGLRQGDPLSPYLFVLVMEVLHLGFLQLIEQDMQFTYHWKCESAKVFQLGFADDLLLFCRADLDSLRVLKMGLDRFAEWSGLRLNVQKSHVIISRSAQGWKDQILAAMGFQEGHLPMRYLGIPLLSSRLSIADCQPLLLKIDARIKGWEGISLSYAGRVQIIKSVLSAMSIYWASAFILPKAIIKQIEKRLRNFLWKGTYTSGYAKVAWKDVCKPIVEGGQGIKDIGILNRALMAKKLCDVI